MKKLLGRRKLSHIGYWLPAILFTFLPLCVNATTIDFYTDGTIQSGDYYNFVTLHDFATVTMTGGIVNGVRAFDTSVFNFQSGTIGTVFQFYGSSTANISGGAINGGVISMYDNSVLNISGGTIHGASMGNSTILNLSGGNLSGYFYVKNIANIYGRDLTLVQQNDNYLASGHWADGTSFQFTLARAIGYGTQIVFHEIPEPTMMLLLGLGAILTRKRFPR